MKKPNIEKAIPFPVLHPYTCGDLDCSHRSRMPKKEYQRRWTVLVIRLAGVMCLSAIFGLIAGTSVIVSAQTNRSEPTPAQSTLQQFEIQDSRAAIRDLTVQVQGLSKDVATMQGIGMGLAAILLVLQIAQIVVGRDFKRTGPGSN
jgi:hypothetical protein